MILESSPKVTPDHLSRQAYVYVRQSTLRQVQENTESTARQYGLRQRALDLGWMDAQITTIDSDLGQSGSSVIHREGFQELMAAVGTGRVGIVMGLEVSRLARNSADWFRLLEFCALTGTLILDNDGLYDPLQFNDRLVLGLKGTMSEAELYVIRSRLRGGMLSKVRKGEMRIQVPIGYVHDEDGRITLDPDQQVQNAVRLLFETYRRTGAAFATVRTFQNEGWKYPRKTRQGEVVWKPLTTSLALQTLHHPCYAGAYVWGRTKTRKLPEGKAHIHRVPEKEWIVCWKDAHPAYVSWEEYESNQARLREGDLGKNRGLPREGLALLQGLVHCGKCGALMKVRYHTLANRTVVNYTCINPDTQGHHPVNCESLTGTAIDAAVGSLVVELMSAQMVELTLAVQTELRERAEEADRLCRQQVERAQYEAEKAQRRYMKVDFDNRLVAGTLEKEWNDKLLALNQAREVYERQRAEAATKLTVEQEQRIRALVTEFPKAWNDPETPAREKKRLLRLLVEDVTLTRRENNIHAGVRFKGGAVRELLLPKPKPCWEARKTAPEVIERIRCLTETLTEGQIARTLQDEGALTGTGVPWNPGIVRALCSNYQIPTYSKRLKAQGWLTGVEMGERLGISPSCCHDWFQKGYLEGRLCNDHKSLLYAPIPPNHPAWARAQGITKPSKTRPRSTQQGAI